MGSQVIYSGKNSPAIVEGDHVNEAVVYISDETYCSENLVVTAGATAIPHNSIILKADKSFRAFIGEGVPAGKTKRRAGLVRGHIELAEVKVNWPADPDAADGDVDGEISDAEQAAADEALKVAVKAEMEAIGFVFRT